MYKLLLHPKVGKRIARIMRGDRSYAEKIMDEVMALKTEPRPCNVENLGNLYRIRVGEYRVIYAVFDKQKTIVVGKIVRRTSKTYKDLKAIAQRTLTFYLNNLAEDE